MTIHGHFGHAGVGNDAVDPHGVITVLREQIRRRVQDGHAFVFHQMLRLTVYGVPAPNHVKNAGLLPLRRGPPPLMSSENRDGNRKPAFDTASTLVTLNKIISIQ